MATYTITATVNREGKSEPCTFKVNADNIPDAYFRAGFLSAFTATDNGNIDGTRQVHGDEEDYSFLDALMGNLHYGDVLKTIKVTELVEE